MDSSSIGTSTKARKGLGPFLVLGTAAVIGGGLFSAATARSASYHSAWSVAYVVLVVGIAQVALGFGQWWLTSRPLGLMVVVSELVIFNLGNTGVVVGTVTAFPLWVDLGSVLLVIALAGFGWSVLKPRIRGGVFASYWVLIGLLLISVCVGLFFANVGAP